MSLAKKAAEKTVESERRRKIEESGVGHKRRAIGAGVGAGLGALQASRLAGHLGMPRGSAAIGGALGGGLLGAGVGHLGHKAQTADTALKRRMAGGAAIGGGVLGVPGMALGTGGGALYHAMKGNPKETPLKKSKGQKKAASLALIAAGGS